MKTDVCAHCGQSVVYAASRRTWLHMPVRPREAHAVWCRDPALRQRATPRISGEESRQSVLAMELRTAYFRTRAGTYRCYDAEAWERVAEAAREYLGVSTNDIRKT